MLELNRRVVPPVDPGCGGVLDVDQGLQEAGVEDVGGGWLGLLQVDDRLHQPVVIGLLRLAMTG